MNEWNQKEISRNAAQQAADEEILSSEDIVILMQGKNSFDERVYCYLKLDLDGMKKMKEAIVAKEEFMPSDFGEVLAAGQGQPPAELRAEMAVTYGMMQAPKVEPKKPALMQKPLWDE